MTWISVGDCRLQAGRLAFTRLRARPAPWQVLHGSAITWPDLPAAQQPVWPDQAALDAVLAELRAQPPLVFAGECDILTEHLGKAARGEAFVLTGGDCAETFAANTADSIRARLKTVLQMSVVLTYSTGLPTLKSMTIVGIADHDVTP